MDRKNEQMKIHKAIMKGKKKANRGLIGLLIVVIVTNLFFCIPVQAGDYTDDLYLEYNDNVYKYAHRLITVEINGQVLETGDMPAVLVNDDTTMVPVREVFESKAIGATVNWNGATQEVYISYLDQFIVLKIDSNTAYVNNKPIDLKVPAMLIRDMSKDYPKTMLPLRFVSENLGFDVAWDAETYTAKITTKESEGTKDSQQSDNSQEDENKTDSSSQDSDQDSTDSNNSETDLTIVSGEQLDKLEGTKANRELPTKLFNSPVIFEPKDDVKPEDTMSQEESKLEIESKELEATRITSIKEIDSNEGLGFYIHAASGISDVQTHVWDGKFIVEIKRSQSALTKAIYEYSDNPLVSSIRIGVHEDDNEMNYTKIVFDLKSSGYVFNLSLNEDRRILKVEAASNAINKMKLAQNDKGDYIDIEGGSALSVKTFRLSNPTRIVFDFPNTKTQLGYQEGKTEGQYVTDIRTAQFDETTTRIVIETDGQPDYQILESGDKSTRIQILEPTYDNVTYDNTEETPTIVLDKDNNGLTIDNITYVDNYLDREYIITLPGDYTDYFGSGKVSVNDAIIDHISFELNDSGNTEVTIKSNVIREFRIEENDNGIIIKAYKPSELHSKVIVLDAGHGGKDPGAVVGEYQEKDVVLGVMLELKKLLDQDDSFKVYYTRIKDEYPSLEDRCVLANEVEADAFISIHSNSYTSNFSGTETLYLPGPDTEGLNAFEMAEIFQKVFTDMTELENYKMKERDNLYVLNQTDMPAIILEMGYLTNEHDRSYLVDEDYYDDLAAGIYASIVKVFETYPTGR